MGIFLLVICSSDVVLKRKFGVPGGASWDSPPEKTTFYLLFHFVGICELKSDEFVKQLYIWKGNDILIRLVHICFCVKTWLIKIFNSFLDCPKYHQGWGKLDIGLGPILLNNLYNSDFDTKYF